MFLQPQLRATVQVAQNTPAARMKRSTSHHPRLPLTLPIGMFKKYQTWGMSSFLNRPKQHLCLCSITVYHNYIQLLYITIFHQISIFWWFPHDTDWCKAPTANSSPKSLAKACALPISLLRSKPTLYGIWVENGRAISNEHG